MSQTRWRAVLFEVLKNSCRATVEHALLQNHGLGFRDHGLDAAEDLLVRARPVVRLFVMCALPDTQANEVWCFGSLTRG